MQVKIKDIAKKAGVSSSAVSLALNGKPGIGEETRRRILRIASEMRTVSLSEGRKRHTIGNLCFIKVVKHGKCLNPDLDVFIASYIDGLEHEAWRNAYGLEVHTLHGEGLAPSIAALARTAADGMIVLGTELRREDLDHFRRVRIPIVFMDTTFDCHWFDFVTMNSIGAVGEAIRHLYENGHREIGFLRSKVPARNFELRELGVELAFRELGLRLRSQSVFAVDPTFAEARAEMLEMLKRRTRLPTALFCSNDIMAYGCIQAFKESGARVPEDISVVGFDNLPMSSHMDPPLTTIQVSRKEIGMMAVKLLLNRIQGHFAAPSLSLEIGGTLVCRKSVRDLRA